MAYQYFKIKKENQHYKGVRYFRVNFDHENATQVCLSSGEPRRGMGQPIGLYLIAKTTFFQNYFQFYTEPATKAQYDKAIKQIMLILK